MRFQPVLKIDIKNSPIHKKFKNEKKMNKGTDNFYFIQNLTIIFQDCFKKY